MIPSIQLKAGRDRSVLRRHPWIFSGAIDRLQGSPHFGETVLVQDHTGKPLGWGAFSPHSQIRVRLWTFNPEETINDHWFENQINHAIQYRVQQGIPSHTSAWRVIASESDHLPGLVVDQYGDHLVCQFLSAGAEHWKPVIVEILKKQLNPKSMFERSDSDSRQKEGLKLITGPLTTDSFPERVLINENGIQFNVDCLHGHKTGFYLDQRENRSLVQSIAKNKRVLNCFAYTGGFGASALAGQASHVTHIESVGGLLPQIEQNMLLNGFSTDRFTSIKGDVFQVLRQMISDGQSYDMVILDPPKFVESASKLNQAARGYKDINRLAFQLLDRGGILVTFSCSGHMSTELFQKVVADAAIEAGRDATVLKGLMQAPDHPVHLAIPESLYLKGLIVVVRD